MNKREHNTRRCLALSCAVLLAATIAAGCNLSTTTTLPGVIEAPAVMELDQDQTPPDVKLVIAAIINRLRDKPNVPQVSFTGQEQVKAEKGFTYEGFTVNNVAITAYEAESLDKRSYKTRLGGVILFKDQFGRRAGVHFGADYVADSSGRIKIQKSAAAGIPPHFPRVECFFVPKAELDAIDLASVTDYETLYLLAMTIQEPMIVDTAEACTASEGEYYILVFCKDRIYQESSLEVKVTPKPKNMGLVTAEAVYLNDSGFRIAVAGGELKLTTDEPTWYVGVKYDIDPEPQTAPPYFVADFSNQKQVREERTLKAEAVQGPLSSGTRFLDPADRQDAGLIQARLKELGYYSGRIDGAFGKGSMAALNAFAAGNGLARVSRWNMEVQKALFAGTGK